MSEVIPQCDHKDAWIPVLLGQYVKCEKCGETRTNPQQAQAEAQESKELNRSAA